MKMKVTVEQFLKAGFVFVAGDKVTNGTGYCIIGDDIGALTANHNHPLYKKFIVKSLTHHPNTGIQSVGDNCVVDYVLCCGTKGTGNAGYKYWATGKPLSILTWTPNLQSILEQQMNTDKSALELTERDIEDAIDNSDIERVLAESDEWVNGDECVYGGELFYYVAAHPKKFLDIIYNKNQGLFEVAFNLITKPLTPEQIEAKKREEFIRGIVKVVYPECDPSGEIDSYSRGLWGRIYDAGYRK